MEIIAIGHLNNKVLYYYIHINKENPQNVNIYMAQPGESLDYNEEPLTENVEPEHVAEIISTVDADMRGDNQEQCVFVKVYDTKKKKFVQILK